MVEPKRTAPDYPSNLYFKAIDFPEGKAQDEVMARRAAKLATLCRAADALLRVAKTMRDSDRHGMVFDQLPLLDAAVADVQGRADDLTEDIHRAARAWRCRPTVSDGYKYASGGWVPDGNGAQGAPPAAENAQSGGRLGTFIVTSDGKSGGVTPADFAAVAEQHARNARRLG